MKLQTYVHIKPQQRTQSIIQKLEQDIKNLEKIKQRNAIRVERLLSINLKDLGYVCNYSMTIENKVQSRRCFRSRKKDLQLKLDSNEDYFKYRNESTLSPNKNYWAKLAYRQSHLGSDRQHRVI
ncbi:unnamed protein product [Paramecium pentaurelia]|uniref:Uncharacterized protein n=1 Tax=Paramecium pentaurelia TaxID=43138 RepID=A0A8S1UYG6_9CILI|nr:unnamed protein product [Paramecium pentaurelia]